jgi:hypothetical protein
MCVTSPRCLPASLEVPAFPPPTNFCNSTIDNNPRNARKSVYHLPNWHRHLYSVQVAVSIHSQGAHWKRLKAKTHLHRHTANGTERVGYHTEATERRSVADGDTIAQASPLSTNCCIPLRPFLATSTSTKFLSVTQFKTWLPLDIRVTRTARWQETIYEVRER